MAKQLDQRERVLRFEDKVGDTRVQTLKFTLRLATAVVEALAHDGQNARRLRLVLEWLRRQEGDLLAKRACTDLRVVAHRRR